MKRGISYVCISLARAQDRRAKMAEQFAAHDIDARFFDAFELKGSVDTIPGYDAAGRQRRYGWPLSRGEVGWLLSQPPRGLAPARAIEQRHDVRHGRRHYAARRLQARDT
ncbi:glycosyltransferase family 25 protein [Burkholderia stagnalis]|uniref:glycosyltransferase family 25 protein n=1 Tax=Burkholderia stagnalis TaxID=1503054 RepID=UPI0039BF27B4